MWQEDAHSSLLTSQWIQSTNKICDGRQLLHDVTSGPQPVKVHWCPQCTWSNVLRMRHHVSFTLTWFKRWNSKHQSALSVRCGGEKTASCRREQLFRFLKRHAASSSSSLSAVLVVQKMFSSLICFSCGCGLAFSSSYNTDLSLLRRACHVKAAGENQLLSTWKKGKPEVSAYW